MNGGFITRLSTWAKTPFSEQMDLWQWILFLIFATSVTLLWAKIMRPVIQENL